MKIAGKKIGLSTQIFAAMLLGAVLGIVIGEPMTKVGFIGTIWLNCIKMIVVPMVLVTIVTGVVSQKDMKTLGRISFRIMAYYVITTLVACAIGILVTSIVKPGTIANFTGLASKEVTGSADITVADFFTGMFSSNIIQTFADGNILQTVVIAILLGVAILRMKNPEHKEKAIKGMNVLNDMVFSLIMCLQNMNDPEQLDKFMGMFFSNSLIASTVIFMLAVGATFPMFLFPHRAFSLTRH